MFTLLHRSLIVSLLVPAAATIAAPIGINFGSQDVVGGPAGAVVKQVGWTNLTNNVSPSSDNLLDANGASTGAMLSGFTNGNSATQNGPGYSGTDPDVLLMTSNIRSNSASSGNNVISFEISSLPAAYTGAGYDVYLYFDSSNNSSATVTLAPAGGSAINKTILDSSATNDDADDYTDSDDYTYIVGDNYAVFTGLTASSFTISITPETGQRSFVNGVQIVDVPEPATLALCALGALAALPRRRRGAR